LAKVDNLGLGCVVAGLALQADSLAVALKLLLIWPLALVASAAISYVIARRADALGIAPWREDGP
jgi:multicomponent Na+:H+ antiporter subunit G